MRAATGCSSSTPCPWSRHPTRGSTETLQGRGSNPRRSSAAGGSGFSRICGSGASAAHSSAALVRQRAVAYVTRECNGRTELLTIAPEGFPEAGVEVPAGRLDHGETLEEGLFRELAEETGFTGARIVKELPDFECTYESYSRNHAFHLVAEEDTPASWRHVVHGDGVDSGMVHVCRWVSLTEDLELWNARDPMLAKLGVRPPDEG